LKFGRIPYGSFPEPLPITAFTPHNDVIPVLLMSVFTHSEVTTKFKCVVQVVAAMSCQAEELCYPIGIY